MNTNKKLLALAISAFVGLAVVACGPDYEKTVITQSTQTPLGGEVKPNLVSVPEGMIVTAYVAPFDDDDEHMQAHVISRDDTVLEVIAVVNDRNYAFIGKKPGKTLVEFQADGETVFVVEAEVTAQPAPEESGSQQ
jgi:hypothetical protein